MPAVSYHGILDSLRQIFETDPRTADAPVYMEKDPGVDILGAQKAILIYLDSRKPHDDQPVAAGSRIRWLLKISVWGCGYAIDLNEATAIRDELTGQIELVLMANRTIKDKVATSWLMGGAFLSTTVEGHIFSMAETEVVADVVASNG